MNSNEDEGTDKAGVISQVKEFLLGNIHLYEQILAYKPIDFRKLHINLKDANIKISAQDLMNILDEQVRVSSCILSS